MNQIEHALIQVLSQRFPWWGNCHFSLVERSRSLYVYAEDASKRDRILNDLPKVAGANLGVGHLILVQPPYAEAVMDCSATGSTEISFQAQARSHPKRPPFLSAH